MFGVMASWRAEDIRDKFKGDTPGKLTDTETRFWARLNRVFDGDLDAFDRPDMDPEDAQVEAIMRMLEESPTGTVAVGLGEPG